mgnify:CR=1 FL=1
MKKVLLTGGAGSIGVHTFIHIFHNTDWEVVIVDSFEHKGLTERITEMMREHPDYWKRLKVITADLAVPFTEKLKSQIGNVDYIINMASLSDVEASIVNPVPFVQNNVNLTLNVLEFARTAKPEAFIQISTDEVYGASGEKQAYEEWSAIVPSNPYSASKACQEAIAISYWRSFGVPVIITNTMNNFGEYQQSSKYPVIIQKAVMEGKTLTVHGTKDSIGTRYYIHSRNHADALLYILQNLPPYLHHEGEVDKPDRYNVVGDVQVSNLTLAQTIARLMDRELKYELVDFHANRPGHDRHYGLDGKKLKKLGWKSPLSFETSLKNTIDWQSAHNDWIK